MASFTRIATNFLPDVDGTRTLLEKMRTDAPFVSMMPLSLWTKREIQLR